MWLNYSAEQMKHARLSKILFNVTNINYLFRIYKQPMLDRVDIRPPKCAKNCWKSGWILLKKGWMLPCISWLHDCKIQPSLLFKCLLIIHPLISTPISVGLRDNCFCSNDLKHFLLVNTIKILNRLF